MPPCLSACCWLCFRPDCSCFWFRLSCFWFRLSCFESLWLLPLKSNLMDPRMETSARLCGVNWQPVSKSRNVMGCSITETRLIPHLRPRHLCSQRCWECQIQMMTMRRCPVCGLSAGRDTVRHTEFCCKVRGGHIVHLCEEHLKEHFLWSSGSRSSSEDSSRSNMSSYASTQSLHK